MVKIILTKKGNAYQSLEVTGHAQAGDYGNDLVCAAITGIVSGALNAYDQEFPDDVELIVKDNEIKIILQDLENQDLQLTMQFLINQLKTIAVQYPKNVIIKEVN